MKSLKSLNLKNKRVLIRVDFNVPLKKNRIQDDKKIKAALPTIKSVLKQNPKKIILMSHLGRPKGRYNKDLSLKPIANKLEKLIKIKVEFLKEPLSQKVKDQIETSKNKIFVLENLRFYKEEKKNNKQFAKDLSKLADIYINDAFGTSHRSHASVEAVTKFLPSYPGLLLQKEIEIMSKALKKPKKPFIVILGGSKVSDKIGVIKNLLRKADVILIGGAMMFTFYKSLKKETGKSLVEKDKLKLAKKLLKTSKRKLILPIDTVITSKINNKAKSKTVDIDNIPKNMIGVDIGPETIEIYKEIISKAKTIIWNGSLGINEIKKFAKGTNEIAKAIAKNKKAISIIGGGDTAAAVDKLKLKFTHVSTGGGASLEFLEGKKLPAIKALEKSKN